MKRTAMFVSVIVILAMLLTSCAPPTPQVIEKEKIVEKVVTQVVKEEVKVVETQVVEVEKQVEVVVTPTAEPAPQQQMIMGFPAATETGSQDGAGSLRCGAEMPARPGVEGPEVHHRRLLGRPARRHLRPHLLLARQVRGDDRRLL